MGNTTRTGSSNLGREDINSWRHMTHRRSLISAGYVVGLVLLVASLFNQLADAGEWKSGRATWYGGPEYFTDAYLVRGKGAFGQLTYGSCGWTDSDGTLPIPKETAAALSDENDDFPGSCGRCYEVRCKSGPIYGKDGYQVQLTDQWYMAEVDSVVKDEFGRSFLGNPGEYNNTFNTVCWPDAPTIRVQIVDSCPCIYEPFPGDVRVQEVCCGVNSDLKLAGQYHFDLSFWAFQQLAHPTNGLMMLEYRPVDCETEDPLPFLPGFVSKQLYKDEVGTGWNWYPYLENKATISVPGVGVYGSDATCYNLKPGGSIGFYCRECTRPGYQPFVGISSISLWVRSDYDVASQTQSSSTGATPHLRIALFNEEEKRYCGAGGIYMDAFGPIAQDGSWSRLNIPIEEWRCEGSYPGLDEVDRIDFENTNDFDAFFCLDDIILMT